MVYQGNQVNGSSLFTVVLNYNGADDTLECVDSLRGISTSDFDHTIVVVDNGSDPTDVSLLRQLPPDVILITSSVNTGYAEGNNIGIRYALTHGADYIFILNNDTVVESACLQELYLLMRSNRDVGIACPMHYYYNSDKLINYAGGTINWWSYHHGAIGTGDVDNGQYGVVPYDTGFASGAAMLIRKEVFESVGLLDSDLFLLYEDLDISVRALRASYRVMVHPLAIIWHKESKSFRFQRGRMSATRAYYSARNQIRFRRKFSTAPQWLAYNLSLWSYRIPAHNLYWLLTTRTPKITLSFFRGIWDGYLHR